MAVVREKETMIIKQKTLIKESKLRQWNRQIFASLFDEKAPFRKSCFTAWQHFKKFNSKVVCVILQSKVICL